LTYLAELQETRAAVREHGGEFNSFSRVLTGVLVRWDGTRGVSVTDLRTNLRSPPFLAKPGTHFDRLRVRAGGFEVFAGAEELVSLVLHGRQLLGEGRDFDGRGHHGRSVTVVCATRHRRASSCQIFSNLRAGGPRRESNRTRVEPDSRVTGSDLPQAGKKIFPPFLPVLRFGDLRASLSETLSPCPVHIVKHHGDRHSR